MPPGCWSCDTTYQSEWEFENWKWCPFCGAEMEGIALPTGVESAARAFEYEISKFDQECLGRTPPDIPF